MAGVVDSGGVEPGRAALDGTAQPGGVLGIEAGDLVAHG
jgi:hypothetical protein